MDEEDVFFDDECLWVSGMIEDNDGSTVITMPSSVDGLRTRAPCTTVAFD